MSDIKCWKREFQVFDEVYGYVCLNCGAVEHKPRKYCPECGMKKEEVIDEQKNSISKQI